jgi:hypothetical protein
MYQQVQDTRWMSEEQARLRHGQAAFKTSFKFEKPAKLRWYTSPPALLITYSSVSGNEKLVNTIGPTQSPKIAMKSRLWLMGKEFDARQRFNSLTVSSDIRASWLRSFS